MAKFIIIASLVLFGLTTVAEKKTPIIRGQISLTEEIKKSIPEKGVLFIFARAHGGEGRRPPLAVKRIVSPKFPLAFELSDQDSMVPGTKFEGQVKLTARFSPNGMVFPKTGSFEGTTGEKEPITVGASRDAMIVIDKKL